jgi:hypothetical protein
LGGSRKSTRKKIGIGIFGLWPANLGKLRTVASKGKNKVSREGKGKNKVSREGRNGSGETGLS